MTRGFWSARTEIPLKTWPCKLLKQTDMTFVLPKHCDWLMPLLTVQKFGKIKLDPKNKRVAFSQSDIHVLCEDTCAQSAVGKILLTCKLITQKNPNIRCVKAFGGRGIVKHERSLNVANPMCRLVLAICEQPSTPI